MFVSKPRLPDLKVMAKSCFSFDHFQSAPSRTLKALVGMEEHDFASPLCVDVEKHQSDIYRIVSSAFSKCLDKRIRPSPFALGVTFVVTFMHANLAGINTACKFLSSKTLNYRLGVENNQLNVSEKRVFL